MIQTSSMTDVIMKKRKRMNPMDQLMITKKQMVEKGEKITTISMSPLPLYGEEKSHVFIPEDVIFEILGRLPARSVGRFRCVCKSWLSATTSLPFIRSHTQHNRITRQSLIIHRPKSKKKYFLASTDVKTYADISLRQFPGRTPQIIASCEGLLCFETIDGGFIVNPLTGYSSKLQMQDKRFYQILGFYFHQSTSKYRVLQGGYNIRQETFVSVVGEKSMRSIPSCLPAFNHQSFMDFKGNLYWLAFTDPINVKQPDTITTFDKEWEVYSLLSLPPMGKQHYIGGSLVDFNGKLGLWVMGNDNIIDVWIMETSWVKRYSLNYVDVNRCSRGLGVSSEEDHWVQGAAGIVRGEELLIDLIVSTTHHHLIRCNLKSGACFYEESKISNNWLSTSLPYMEALTYPVCSSI